MSKNVQEPVMGIPYNQQQQQQQRRRQDPPPPMAQSYPYPQPQPQYHQQQQQQQYYVGQNPYQAGAIPPNAVVGDPKGIPIQQTIYRDSPAPFNCLFCGNSGLTTVRSKPSLAAVIGCMMPMMLGICFLCPSMDCLWHKYHYCPSCNEKVADYKKSDPCAVMDPPRWVQQSFALPA